MMFNVDIGNMVVLVVDERHDRHGQIGQILYHDWKEYGGIGVKFSDGYREEFYDGIMKGDQPSGIKRFYRHVNTRGAEFDKEKAGPESFKKEFLQHGGNLAVLAEQYKSLFNEHFNC